MNIAIFGGSGATGQRVIAALLADGLQLRALCRTADALSAFTVHPAGQLTVIEGSVTDRQAVEETLRGCDAALCLFGPRPPYTDIFCAEVTATIVTAMQKLAVPRLICQTGAMIGDYPANRSWAMKKMVAMFNRRYPALAHDRNEQERIVQQSDRQWTLIKPPRLTEAKAAEQPQVGSELRVGILSSVSRIAVAKWLVDELRHPANIEKILFLKR